MSTSRTVDRRDRLNDRRPLKSPLAVPGGSDSPDGVVGAANAYPVREALSDRAATRAEFEEYLRTSNNRGRWSIGTPTTWRTSVRLRPSAARATCSERAVSRFWGLVTVLAH
jgi:hypothetical protein